MDPRTLQDTARLLSGADPKELNLPPDQLASVTNFLSASGLLEKTKITLPTLPLGPRPPVPIGIFLLESTTIPPTGIPLAKGSVWLYAPQFGGGASASSWAGFLATAGRLTLQGTATLISGVIHLQTNAILTLAATIQPIPAPPHKPEPEPIIHPWPHQRRPSRAHRHHHNPHHPGPTSKLPPKHASRRAPPHTLRQRRTSPRHQRLFRATTHSAHLSPGAVPPVC